MMNLRNIELNHLDENKSKTYIMLILQFKLMTNNGFGILLILVERIKIDMAQTWEGLDGTTGRIENERRKDKETSRRIRK